ncbi:archaetidylserine decarboxylase, partial [Methylomagnum sp.]
MSILEKLFVLIQYPLPHHFLSRLIGYLTHCRNPAFKNFFIRTITKIYGVDLSEAEQPDPNAYACFNDFFTRALKPGVRPLADAPGVVAGPADGYMSQLGPITEGRIIQAKGKDYSAVDLLGGDAARAEPFMGGNFATIYLSPKDYHRLHMPLAGTLREMVHVPGRLFSVNNATAKGVPDLFARNERVVAIFDTEAGPMALILVGAIFVASIETVWHGLVTPPAGQAVRVWEYRDNPVQLGHGAEMGRFKMGSTIIVLFGKDAVEWGNFAPGEVMR